MRSLIKKFLEFKLPHQPGPPLKKLNLQNSFYQQAQIKEQFQDIF